MTKRTMGTTETMEILEVVVAVVVEHFVPAELSEGGELKLSQKATHQQLGQSGFSFIINLSSCMIENQHKPNQMHKYTHTK